MIRGGRQKMKERKTKGMNSPPGERLTYEGTGHVAGNKWVVRRR
jgi:hypothetical protein